jgi:hypothetical protein
LGEGRIFQGTMTGDLPLGIRECSPGLQVSLSLFRLFPSPPYLHHGL